MILNSPIYIVLDLFVTAFLAVLLTAKVIQFSARRSLLDYPNERSLHDKPVPRGGGIVVVVIALVHIIALAVFSNQNTNLLLALTTVVVVLGGVGLLDDYGHVSQLTRFAVQTAIACVVVAILGYLTRIQIGTTYWQIGVAGSFVSVVWIVWMINLYNFMDGIDGIAALQAIIGSGFLAVWFSWSGDGIAVLFCVGLIGAASGFLYFNWSPAKIFLGDVGSLTLGGIFATLALWGSLHQNIPFLAFVVLFAVFIADATGTLLRRMVTRQTWWRAHRMHFYQLLVQSGMSHKRVSCITACLMIVMGVLATLLTTNVGAHGLWLILAVLILSAYGVVALKISTKSNSGENVSSI